MPMAVGLKKIELLWGNCEQCTSIAHPEACAFPMPPGLPIIAFGAGDRAMPDGTLDVFALHPGFVGLA